LEEQRRTHHNDYNNMATEEQTKKILTSESHPLRVDFVPDLPTKGKLGASPPALLSPPSASALKAS
jgi:hypothetical protein